MTLASAIALDARERRLVEPVEVDGVALAREQRHGFVERQTNHGGIRSGELHDESAGDALDGVAARLVAPLGTREVAFDFTRAQPLEAEAGLNEPAPHLALRGQDADRGEHAMG